MKKVPLLLLVSILILISGYLFLKNKYPNNFLNSYTPQGPTYQNEENSNMPAYPVKQMDQGADAARTSNIELAIQPALAQYYSKYGKAPVSLESLVTEKMMKSIPTDPLTNQEPEYLSDYPDRGCKAWYVLSDGAEVAAYCY